MKRAVEAAAAALVVAVGAVGVAKYVWSDYGPLFGASWWLGAAILGVLGTVLVAAIVSAVVHDDYHDDDYY